MQLRQCGESVRRLPLGIRKRQLHPRHRHVSLGQMHRHIVTDGSGYAELTALRHRNLDGQGQSPKCRCHVRHISRALDKPTLR